MYGPGFAVILICLFGIVCVSEGVGVKNFTRDDISQRLDEFMKDPRKATHRVPKYDPNDPKLKRVRAEAMKFVKKRFKGNISDEEAFKIVMHSEKVFFAKHEKIKKEMEEEKLQKKLEEEQNKIQQASAENKTQHEEL